MPQHYAAGSPALQFDLAAPAGWAYAPGDTIIGNLVRKVPIVTPNATIKLSFIGRVKVKITVRRGNNNRSVYRDNWQLVDFNEMVIFQGPLHLAEGSNESLSWPVSVNIPYEPMEYCRRNHSQKCSFIPLDIDHPLHHILPGSFYSETTRWGSNPSSSEIVEYYLQARLEYNFGGNKTSHEAIRPITLRHPVTQTSGIPKMIKQPRLVSTHRLQSGMEDTDLSFKQNVQKFFSSSKVPAFHFDLLFTVPSSLQLDDPTPMPLQLEIMPNLERTSDSIKDVAQTIRIMNIEASLRVKTHCLSAGNFTDSVHDNEYDTKLGFNLQSIIAALDQPLVITTGKGNAPLNLGNLFQLTLHKAGFKAGNQTLPLDAWRGTVIGPSFTTYNIQHTHTLEWKLYVDIAGEKEKYKIWAPVEIIAPA
ncbi:uncharacterized protein N7484_004669 [Penicillium longicatenatum]|uniref:uncharacterized protein n=1 Tax=Penicillium longicatenatum TaxID=1561947 RepID=UPI0025479CD2|nr:uncharacterized protein N7484_004669 [Penicillium longicatenatum]KAJ5650946.1 hypothetical protein N7484_004669 [Penicillium longicatenatum]